MENLSDKNLIQAVKAYILNTTINNYAVERVAFGYEKPGDIAPIDLYIEHLFFGFEYEPQMRKDIPGVRIDAHERISAEFDYSEYVRDLFVYQIEHIFFYAPKDKYLEREGEDIPLPPKVRDFIFGLLPLFVEVLNVDVRYNAFDVIPTDKAERMAEYNEWVSFVTAILLKPLRSGDRINRYVKDIKNPPFYIRRLIEKHGKDFYLKPIDNNSYEYAFALFSLMYFKNDENGKLLELKMFEWERQKKSS